LTVENIITRRDPGARLHIPGASHFELVGDRIIREFALVDELAIWTAIALAAG
jgi:hypothetical protein